MSGTKPSPNYSAPALEKGFDILELLAEEKIPMSLAQISVKLDRSKSELYRMLAVLETRGYLFREPGSDYFNISNKLFDLGMSVPPVGTLVEVAFPMLHRLAAQTQQSCHLAVNSGTSMVVVARAESPSNVCVSVRVGHYMKLHQSGSGLVMLAWMAESKRDDLFEHYAETDPNFKPKALEKKLAGVRKEGYVQNASHAIEGVTDISFPIFLGDREHVIASLTIPYANCFRSPVSLEDVVSHQRETAGKLSEVSVSYGGF